VGAGNAVADDRLGWGTTGQWAVTDHPAQYDEHAFATAYGERRAQSGGPNELIEQPALKSLMPHLEGKDLIDLGCGTGDLARWALENGVATLRGFDASNRMIVRARASTDDQRATFDIGDIERLRLDASSADVVMSGLAMHYVAHFPALMRKVARWLRPLGSFVMSVEHPIMTCAARGWPLADDGTRQHWPVDHYLDEGARNVRWLGAEVRREHRTVASYLNAVIDSGLTIVRVLEPGPDTRDLELWPALASHRRRPPFLVIRADKRFSEIV